MNPVRKIFLAWSIGLFPFILETQASSVITVTTDDTELVFKTDDRHKLRQCYYGEKLPQHSITDIAVSAVDAYPSFGTSYINEAAIRAVHADGNTSTELIYDNHTSEELGDGIRKTVITLKDTSYPLQVKLCFKAYRKENIIEQWTEISHTAKKPVSLYNFASSHLWFSETAYFLTQFYGNWADEMNMAEMKLTRGQKVLQSRLGVRSDQFEHPCFLVSFDGPAQENAGHVVGGTLAWPGSWNLTFDVDQSLCLAIPAQPEHRI